jgi:hypothetical protein
MQDCCTILISGRLMKILATESNVTSLQIDKIKDNEQNRMANFRVTDDQKMI